MEKKIEHIIDLKSFKFKGNVLDIGEENHGIVYNLFKNNEEDESTVDYIEGSENKSVLEKEYYHNVVLFFYLSTLWNGKDRRKVLKDAYEFLNPEGQIHIWDISKINSKILNEKIKLILPKEEIKEIKIKDYNIIKEYSKMDALNMLEELFEIKDIRQWNDVYYISAQKKGDVINEDSTSRDKLKVYTQQFSNKVFKSIYQRFGISMPNKRVHNKR
ncbi:class I SAM-dependent methyltransferase [Clostridium simiarum]|uniref:class I SAM-dependent methyltransferase n=1 Tax=Clostridium simiarum TaxID=2841506 RepID=UPI0031B8A939